MQRDPSGKFKGSVVKYEQVDTDWQQDLESLRVRLVKICRNIGIGLRAGSARGSAAM